MDATSQLTPLLIDAKREYVGQLTDVLAPYVINHITALYVAAQRQSRAATVTFQRALREIPVWNANTIQQHTAEVQNRYSFLGDLIAACFVAYVKILSSVKLHQQKPNIRLRLPANDTFVHKVYIHTAREFYAVPTMIATADRASKVAVVRTAVEASVRDMLPIEDILKAYLGNTVDTADNTMNPGEMADDAEMMNPNQMMGGEDDFFQQQQLMQGGQLQMVPAQQQMMGMGFQQQPQQMMGLVQPQQQVMGMVQPQQMVGLVQPQQQVMGMVQPQQQMMQTVQHPQQVMGIQPEQFVTAQQHPSPPDGLGGGGGLFAPQDDAPKQISIGQLGGGGGAVVGGAVVGGAAPGTGQQDLFSDAEDEF